MEESGGSGNLQHAEMPGRQRRVFISYASRDAAVAQKACSALEAAGFPCWIAPRNVVPGTLYAEGIVRALDESRILILILSEQAMESVHVGKELERATSKRRLIIAIRTDTAPLTPAFEYFLSESQWIEAGAGGTNAAIAQLIEAVGQHLPRNSADASTHTPRAHVVGHAAPSSAIMDKSIAVLPFTDMSEKQDQEYFAGGIAEGIIDLLVKIPGVKVIGRSSSSRFKGHNEDLRAIGAKLGVAYVVEGSVRKSRDRVRVTAQLIDVSDGAHRWSRSYDRDLVDVLKVQDEISFELVRALEVSMGADEPRSPPTLKSVEGYSLYLRGRQAFDRHDKQGFDQAASYFRQAMMLDPDSALAPAWLAFVHYSQATYGFAQPRQGFEEARRYAERALSLDPRSELTICILGLVQIQHDWDWAAGAAELDRALALAPGNARVLALHSYAPRTLGEWDAAIRDLNAAIALDPLSPAVYNLLGIAQLAAGHGSEAEAAFRRALEIAPNYTGVHAYLARALLFKGEKQAALRQIDFESNESALWIGRAAINHALGQQAESDAALKRLPELASPNSAYLLACAHASRGESDAAFLWLDRALSQKDSSLWSIKSQPYFNTLKSNPRYKAFLKKMNLPE
jgi:TolB-like protein/Tfp pilus assembly protein PilF